MALYPIVTLRVADVGKVANRQLIVLEMILISEQPDQGIISQASPQRLVA